MENKNQEKVISFGFKAKSDTGPLKTKSAIDETKEELLEKDFVKGFDGSVIKSVKEKEKDTGPLVIPLIQKNNWRGNVSSNKISASSSKLQLLQTTVEENLSKTAAQELIDAAKRLEQDGDGPEEGTSTLSIPLLLQNQVPAGYETDDKIDTELRPTESTLDDYEQVPIEHFGMALLRGMGWKEGEGIGKNKQQIKPIEAQLRPKGMGLGADRSQFLQKQNKSKRKHKPKPGDTREEEESLEVKKGACCVILKGPHIDLYGTIEAVDDDNCRCSVKLSLSQVSVDVSQFSLRIVNKQEFEKYSRYLNKGKSDRYKDRGSDTTGDRASPEEKKRKKDTQDAVRESQPDYSKHKSSSSKHSSSKHTVNRNWVERLLKVKVVDRKYKDGRYYANKLIVYDVLPDSIICRTDSGRLLEGLKENQLESVIPKEDNSHVMIVAGDHKREIAELIQRNKEKEKVIVQLLSDRSNLVTLRYDDVCEYTGSVEHLMEY